MAYKNLVYYESNNWFQTNLSVHK